MEPVNVDLHSILPNAGNSAIQSQLESSIHGDALEAMTVITLLDMHLSITVDSKVKDKVKVNLMAKVADTFELFPNFPTEIRLKIWRESMPGPRIVEIAVHQLGHEIGGSTSPSSKKISKSSELFRTVHISSPNPCPVTLHVNRESREEALKRYAALFPGYTIKSRKLSGDGDALIRLKRPVYVDFISDTPFFTRFTSLVYHGPDFHSHMMPLFKEYATLGGRISHPFPQRIAFLAPRLYTQYASACLILASIIGPKEVVLVVDKTESGKVCRGPGSGGLYRELLVTDVPAPVADGCEIYRDLFVADSQMAANLLFRKAKETDATINLLHEIEGPTVLPTVVMKILCRAEEEG